MCPMQGYQNCIRLSNSCDSNYRSVKYNNVHMIICPCFVYKYIKNHGVLSLLSPFKYVIRQQSDAASSHQHAI